MHTKMCNTKDYDTLFSLEVHFPQGIILLYYDRVKMGLKIVCR